MSETQEMSQKEKKLTRKTGIIHKVIVILVLTVLFEVNVSL